MSKEKKDNFFKIDPECHLIGDMDHLNYFPGCANVVAGYR